MGITDKVSGRIKQAAGDLAGNDSLHRQGKQEERKADAKAELERERERVQRKAEELADLERSTASRRR